MEGTTVVLMGRTGNGKSATGNSILGRNAFRSQLSAKSVTSECEMEQTGWKDGRIINVVDTPGLFDISAPKEFVEKEIVKCINLAKDGVHAVLLVLSTNEFTEEERNVLDNLQMLFGPRIVNYMVVVFTGGDQLENNGFTLEKFLNVCPKHIKELVRRCNSKTVLFDNKTKSEIKKEKQISTLMEHIDSIISENEGEPYSNELFKKAQEIGSQLFYVRDMENAYEEQAKRINEMMVRNRCAMEEKMQEIRRNLEQQLASVQSAQQRAESRASRIKQTSDQTIQNLQQELTQLERNKRAMEENERDLKRNLEQQLCSAENARRQAENETASIRRTSEQRIQNLEEQLRNATRSRYSWW